MAAGPVVAVPSREKSAEYSLLSATLGVIGWLSGPSIEPMFTAELWVLMVVPKPRPVPVPAVPAVPPPLVALLLSLPAPLVSLASGSASAAYSGSRLWDPLWRADEPLLGPGACFPCLGLGVAAVGLKEKTPLSNEDLGGMASERGRTTTALGEGAW